MRSDILIRRALGAALLLSLVATNATAQMHFPEPRATPAYGGYQLAAQCLAAAARVRDSVSWRKGLDSLAYDPLASPPEASVQAARGCGARFTVASVSRASLPALRDLALMAGLDSVAKAATERELAEARGEPLDARAARVRVAVESFIDARPLRVALAREYLKRLDALGPGAARARMDALSLFMGKYVRGTYRIEEYPEMIAAAQRIIRELPPALRAEDPDFWRNTESAIGLAAFEYEASRRSLAEALAWFAQGPWASQTMIARQAPAIVGDFWFGRGGDDSPRPRAGRLSMIVFVNAECRDGCVPRFPILRRIARRFPELDITLVTQTAGHFRFRVPPPPAQEAALDSMYFLGHQGIPAALAVEATNISKLPDPDLRVILGPTVNAVNYLDRDGSTGQQSGFGYQMNTYLVSPRGQVAYAGVMNPEAELALVATLERLFREQSNPTTGR